MTSTRKLAVAFATIRTVQLSLAKDGEREAAPSRERMLEALGARQ
jgi:hypothetical protein